MERMVISLPSEFLWTIVVFRIIEGMEFTDISRTKRNYFNPVMYCIF